jgi:ABC-type multidrug transport system fused ATPase/permease subunit
VLQRLFGPRLSGLPTRAFDMGSLLDTVLVCAVGTILIIRTQLWLTNYPQLGGHGLHIAHLLWGGLGMLIAIVILVSFLSPAARLVGAVLGGIGLGFFIDELGKFLTSDNNYFFKPTAAIIYIFFVAFFLLARALQRRKGFTHREYLVNAIELGKDAAIRDMDIREQRRALALLDQADQSDPLVAPVRRMLESARIRPESKPSLATRIMEGARDRYYRLTEKPWFIRVVTAVFVLWGLGTILEVGGLLTTLSAHLTGQHAVRIVGPITSKAGHFGFVRAANLASSVVSGVFVVWGLIQLRRHSRLAAYEMFERALLISLFLTQVFVFLESQFGACVGFLFSVLLLITIRFMQRSERELELAAARTTDGRAALAQPLPARS